ncbi:DUF2922 domain-containing protein [Peptococcus simiae]|uniref:DUF2922 domain-containing protein n=1 Tax=Peptococcus simiae TaxID=1643805 RepID=A0ABW9GZJ5_9FIRM
MNDQKSLVLTFLTSEGKKASMTLANPKDDLTAQQAKKAMEDMVTSTVFKNGEALYAKGELAQLVTRTTSDLYRAASE